MVKLSGVLTHLERVVPEPPDRPPAAVVPFPIREVTRQIAFEPDGWTPERRQRVAELFDGLAGDWHERATHATRQLPLTDGYERGGVRRGGLCVEPGAGTGARTPFLAGHHDHVITVDLVWEMIRQVPPAVASRLLADSSALPLPSGSIGAVVLVNMFLFPTEVARVLAPEGALVWVNTSGDETPIYLPSDDVAAAMPGEWTGTASEAGWGTWAVLRRAP